MDEKLLEIICCLETYQPLKLADTKLVTELNQRVQKGVLLSRSGEGVKEKMDKGLVREDGKILYPVRQNIPTLLIEQGIQLD